MKKHRFILGFLVLLAATFFAACGGGDGYTPKPKGYMRIDMPEHKYWLVDTLPLSDTLLWEGDTMIAISHDKPFHTFPIIFEANQCAEVGEKDAPSNVTWIDIKYPQWKGIIFLTYKRLKDPSELASEVDTSYQLLSQHFAFSSGVTEFQFVNEDEHVYASSYRIKGQNVASTYQFWATDSINHFLRGSVYIDCVPNNDSLAPVLGYLQMDVEHLLETLKWR